jgi:hypothetical protein
MRGRLLIDTNAYCALMAGSRGVASELAHSEAVLVPITDLTAEWYAEIKWVLRCEPLQA